MKLSFILILPVLIFGFQNCSNLGSTAVTSEEATHEYKAEIVVGPANVYDSIGYLPASSQGWGGLLDLPHALDINLQSGAISTNANGGTKSCALDDARLARIRVIMSNAQLCEPGPLPPDSMVCMAIGTPDILLSSSDSAVSLRPVICHNGLFLCEGKDQLLRDFLSELRNNLPAGCQ